MAQGLWDVVISGYEIPPQDPEAMQSWDENKQKQFEDNQKRDINALTLIHRGVTPSIFPRIMAATTAKEAWKILGDAYKGTQKLNNNMLSANEPSYDRAADLKAFDETKAGVKGLVDAGISTVPPFFINSKTESNPSSPLSPAHKPEFGIPVIDLSRVGGDPDSHTGIVERIRVASESWGFFQVVNHGIPHAVLEEMLKGVRRFHEQDVEVKKEYYTRDVSKKVVYNSNYDLYSGPAANWRDSFYCLMSPHPPDPQDLPSVCREILIEYSKQVMRLGSLLMELLSEALGLNSKHLNNMDCDKGLAVLCHYYPACPQPELTLGTSKHSDDGFLTVLLQDQIGGLQVLHQNHWFDIPPVPGALVVNIGDLLQLITNDKLKSIEHRVLAKREGPRISVACFLSSSFQSTSKVYGPIEELVSEDNPPRYREITVEEYVTFAANKGLDGISPLLNFRL